MLWSMSRKNGCYHLTLITRKIIADTGLKPRVSISTALDFDKQVAVIEVIGLLAI